MGYKIAGYDVIGCNEIDPRMMKCYETNHHPQYSYLEDIRDLVRRNNLPEELYNLDILDGSPPCSTFSMSGLREDAWGKEKKFKEGQKTQVLDTLFFDFIALAKRLKPKIVIAENVKGLLFKQPIYLSRSEVCNISTFPQDYLFLNQSPHYICGMSVPPVMMAQVASRVWKYWLSKL